MSEKFSIRALIRQVRDELGTGDRFLIAQKAMPRIPVAHREAAFMEALAEVARDVVKQGHPRIHPVPAFAPPAVVPKAGNRNSARSSKVASIRRAWPELRATYACIGRDKMLADYTSENLNALADELEKQARQNAAKAANFRKLAVLMDQSGAKKLSDLPDEALAAAFRGEAA